VLRVLIADDHTVVRQGLMQIVARTFGGATFGEARDAQEALNHARQESWDIAILDVTMPGRSGLDIIKDIKQLRPKVPIIILSMYSEDQYAERALKAGASGYITKEKAAEELIEAIQKVLKGGRYVSAALAERWAYDLGGAEKEPHENLSDREFEVFRLIGAGKKPGDIAKTLHLSVKTVNTYRERILDKMQLKSTADLIRYAIYNKLVE
jgi:two-component system, NarL family, invasion response regulator UvrY